MSNISIVEHEAYSRTAISDSMFGTNFVTTYDYEFEQDHDLLKVLEGLGVSTLRFPGGSITEDVFTEASFLTGDWGRSSYIDSKGNMRSFTPLSGFIESAAAIGANVQLVIPTRVAFEQSMGNALAAGTYGSRTEITNNYFDLVRAYLDFALSESQTYGTSIERVELGNEFWGSGQMTAGEYGRLASTLTAWLGREYPSIAVISQVAASANRLSPLSDTSVFLEPDGNGDFIVHLETELGEVPSSDWLKGLIPGSGNAATQTTLIAGAFAANPFAADHLSGIVGHVYFNGGFDGIDGERNFALRTVHDRFISGSGIEEIDYYVTEWSARNPRSSKASDNLGNANGLQYAHITVEAFFELVSNGVDSANFWPLTFGNPKTLHRTLVDTEAGNLTFGGVAFQWLAETTVNLFPIFDFEIRNEIDVHGFSNDNRMVMFISERSGRDRLNSTFESLKLGLGAFSPKDEYFLITSWLNSDDGSLTDVSANPNLSYNNGYMFSGETIQLELRGWDLARVELQFVTDGDDTLVGGVGNDTIRGAGGDDIITGFEGDDSLKGNLGNDTIFGSDGCDILKGGWGSDYLVGGNSNDEIFGDFEDDTLVGGSGNDLLSGGSGDDFLFLGEGENTIEGGDGWDTLSLQDLSVGVNIWLSEDLVEVLGSLTAFSEIEEVIGTPYGDYFMGTPFYRSAQILGEGGDDTFLITYLDDGAVWGGAGSDLIFIYLGTAEVNGGSGDDTIWTGGSGIDASGGSGDDTVFGGNRDDTISGGEGSDLLFGGLGRDTFIFSRGFGADNIFDFDPNYDILFFDNLDLDTAELSDLEGAAFLDFGNGDTITFDNLNFTDMHEFL